MRYPFWELLLSYEWSYENCKNHSTHSNHFEEMIFTVYYVWSIVLQIDSQIKVSKIFQKILRRTQRKMVKIRRYEIYNGHNSAYKRNIFRSDSVQGTMEERQTEMFWMIFNNGQEQVYRELLLRCFVACQQTVLLMKKKKREIVRSISFTNHIFCQTFCENYLYTSV